MGRLRKGLIGAVIVGALPAAANAQTPFSLDTNTTASQKTAEVGGTPTVDIITLSASGPGTPLRYGNIIPNSETVQFSGMTLRQGSDYMMDYSVGVVYLMLAQKAGQSLTVSYRYKPGAAATPQGGQLSNFTTFKYALLPGSVNLLTGLSMAERGEDGSVMTSNVYGLNNSLKLGKDSSLTGLYIVGDRQKTNNQAGLSLEQSGAPAKSSIEAGKSQLILQNLKSKILGGDTSFEYQDVSKNFTNFNTAAGSGIDDKVLNQLRSEKGLVRTGFTTNGLKFGGLKFSNSYKTVKDGDNGINWRSYGVEAGNVKLNWSSQTVDRNFTRSKDLGDANKDQLAKEAGISRENLTAEMVQKFGKLSYTDSKIVDNINHTQISQKLWAIDAGKIKFNLGTEMVDHGFMRFDNLLAQEKVAFGREAGTQRKWMGLQSSFLGKDTPLTFNQASVSSGGGNFNSEDLVVVNKVWNLQHSERKVSTNFVSVGSISDPEIDSHVRTIAAMYGPGIAPTPNDRAQFINTHGLDRKFDGFTNESIKGIKLSGGELNLKGQQDSGKLETFALSSKNVLLSYRHENLGSKFSEITSMMDLEKQRLGMIPGLNRTDISLAATSGKKKLLIENFAASTQTGDATRTTLAYEDTKISIQAAQRRVTNNFTDAPNLVDPGKDLLNQLKGFTEQDIKVKWQLRANMNLDSTVQNMYNPVTNQNWRQRNTILDWSPDKNTHINVMDLEQHNTDSYRSLFDSSVEKISMSKNLGRFGTLTLFTEKDSYGGENKTLQSLNRDYLSYETKISGTTSFRTEQTRTSFANGTHENINSNTISTELNKRVGVSLTDTQVDRQGSNDESHRNYGFWYDLGGGVRVSYGYAHQGMPQNQDTSSSSFSVGTGAATAPIGTAQPVQAGQIGNLQLGGGYYANQWDASNRTQTAGNLGLVTAKPFRLGFISDLKLNVNLDTGSDHTALIRENKLFGATGRIGTNHFGLEYKGQIDPAGNRAIDRTVKLQTDPSEKKLLTATISYKERTMPDNTEVTIRDFSIVARPLKNLTITNQIQTNPDVANPAAILGSIPQASRSNKWRMDYKQSPNLTMGGSWEELLNDQTHSMSRTGGINLKLFERSGSPITIFYGVEQADQANFWRTTQRYSLQFDQKPASNQTFSFFVGSVSYEHSVPVGSNPRNLTVRLNYQFRF